jgi:DNA-binding transcriptional ArsR family regulator
LPKAQEHLSLGFLVLSDATRRDMLARLVEGELSISELADDYDISLPAISKHIQLMEKAGLVTIEKAGRQKRVKLLLEGFDALQIWLEGLGGSDSFLDRLEARIEEFLD